MIKHYLQDDIEEIAVRFQVPFKKNQNGELYFENKLHKDLTFHIADLQFEVDDVVGNIRQLQMQGGTIDFFHGWCHAWSLRLRSKLTFH